MTNLLFRRMFTTAFFGLLAPIAALATPAAAQPLQVLVFGDSLSSGYELPEQQGFPSVLRRRLHADGYNVIVWNGSVPGDTSGDGLARIATALQYNPDLVIVEFGGNDMLDSVDPRVTFSNLDAIIQEPRSHSITVPPPYSPIGILPSKSP
jgi:acyl-CoA thioesterase I